MKVVQISTFLNGGAAIAAFRLHSSLMKYPDVESYFLQKSHISDREYAQKNHIYTAPIGRSYMIRARKKFNIHPEHFHWDKLNDKPRNYEVATFATTSYRLEELPLIKEADIIHLHWVAEFINYPTFFKNIKQPIVWTLHDMNPFMGLFHYEGDEIRNQKLFKKSNNEVLHKKIKAIHQHKDIHIVSPSLWLKEKSEKSLAFKQYTHSVIPYGIDINKFSPINREQTKTVFDVNNGQKTILAIAQNINIYRKGGDLLTQAINMLKTPCNLITVGGAPLNVTSSIKYTHFDYVNELDKLNKLYSAADLTILPSREDNLPNIILESFANGTPILSFNNGGMAEHVKTGQTGILEHNMDSQSLANDIEDFLNDKYNFDDKSIRQYAIDNFSDTLQAERYIQLYKKILGK